MSLKFRKPKEQEDFVEKVWEREGPPPKKRFRKRSKPPILSAENQAYKEKLRWEEEQQRLQHGQSTTSHTAKNVSVPSPPTSSTTQPLINDYSEGSRNTTIYRNDDLLKPHTAIQSNTNTTNAKMDGRVFSNRTNSTMGDRSLTSKNINIAYQSSLPPSLSSLQRDREKYAAPYNNVPTSGAKINATGGMRLILPKESCPPLAHQNHSTPAYQPNHDEKSKKSTGHNSSFKYNHHYQRPYLTQLPQVQNEPFKVYTAVQVSNQADVAPQMTHTMEVPTIIDLAHEPNAQTQQVSTINPNNTIINSNNNNNIPNAQNNIATTTPQSGHSQDIRFIPSNPIMFFDPKITPDPLDAQNYCRSCDIYFKRIIDYRSHLRQFHKMMDLPSVKSYPPDRLPDPQDPNGYCRICKKKPKGIKEYKTHMRKWHYLNIIDERMPQADPNMVIDENDPKNTSCRHCMTKFSDGDHFRRHMKKHHSNGRTKAVRGVMRADPTIKPDPFDPNHYCNSCDQKWNARDKYKHHLIMMHDIETDDSIAESYYCPNVQL